MSAPARQWAAVFGPKSLRSIAIIATLLAGCVTASSAWSDVKNIAPKPEYTPQEVISIVVQSLKLNADDNEGIATVYRFASPRNKTNTGPLGRFTQMIRRGFPDMLNHTGVRYDPMEIKGEVAVQAVWLETSSGEEFGYAFQLRKQRSGRHANMWMTDAVVPLGQSERSGVRI